MDFGNEMNQHASVLGFGEENGDLQTANKHIGVIYKMFEEETLNVKQLRRTVATVERQLELERQRSARLVKELGEIRSVSDQYRLCVTHQFDQEDTIRGLEEKLTLKSSQVETLKQRVNETLSRLRGQMAAAEGRHRAELCRLTAEHRETVKQLQLEAQSRVSQLEHQLRACQENAERRQRRAQSLLETALRQYGELLAGLLNWLGVGVADFTDGSLGHGPQRGWSELLPSSTFTIFSEDTGTASSSKDAGAVIFNSVMAELQRRMKQKTKKSEVETPFL